MDTFAKAEIVRRWQAYMDCMESAAAAENNLVELIDTDIFAKTPIHGMSINVNVGDCDAETASLLRGLFEEATAKYPQFGIKVG